MIQFRDFVPQGARGGWLKVDKYEDFDAAVAAASEWLQESGVTPIQIETVVLPNIHSEDEEGTTDSELGTVSGWATWYQFLRVWY